MNNIFEKKELRLYFISSADEQVEGWLGGFAFIRCMSSPFDTYPRSWRSVYHVTTTLFCIVSTFVSVISKLV